jgi:hypothetical protein
VDGSDPLIEELLVLVDPDAPRVARSMEVGPSVSTVDEVRFQLETFFAEKDAPGSVNVMVRGSFAGVATREDVIRSGRSAGTQASPYPMGGGERLQLAGVSTGYRLLTFGCAAHACAATAHRIHYPERDLPTCGHGRMELRG